MIGKRLRGRHVMPCLWFWGEAMTITIEAGKCYRTYSGNQRGPMRKNTRKHVCPHEWECATTGCFYHGNGTWAGAGNSLDIIEEWTDTPVKEFGTIAEIGAQVGDVVEGTSDGCGSKYVKTISSIGPFRVEYEVGGYDWLGAKGFRIICRASDVTPEQPGPVVTESITRKQQPKDFGITTAPPKRRNSRIVAFP